MFVHSDDVALVLFNFVCVCVCVLLLSPRVVMNADIKISLLDFNMFFLLFGCRNVSMLQPCIQIFFRRVPPEYFSNIQI